MNQQLSETLHRSLVTVYRVSSYLDFPFTLNEVADYFLPGVNISGNQLRQIILGGEYEDIPFSIQADYLLTRPDQKWRIRSFREMISARKLRSAERFARPAATLVWNPCIEEAVMLPVGIACVSPFEIRSRYADTCAR